MKPLDSSHSYGFRTSIYNYTFDFDESPITILAIG